MSVGSKDLITDLFSQFDLFYNKHIGPFNQVVAPINQVLEKIAKEVFDNDVTSDQIKLLLCFVGIIPLGFILFQIKSPLLRHVYSSLLGFILSFLVYGGNVISSHVMTLVTYILCAIFGRHSQKVVFVFCLTFLSVHHIYRQITDYGGWRMDVSVILMMNFCKLVSFAFCYSDGFKDEKQLSEDQKERRIQKLPNIFSFFSYINFLGSAIAGPTFDYYEFDNFINLKNGYANIPHPILDTFKNLGIGMVYLFITARVLPKFPLEHVLTPEYGDLNLLSKVVYYNLAIIKLEQDIMQVG
ncbi:membrane-bound O-acyltransferase family MBOAT protein (macronuclear) [Tetrahymena thermophila SB210]|uniref:Membrane-bound O-acyltransferase family MBOAT protein n=1 Tax=Tetrahymena thermophila (strain SB210) TaxID=312017 RepID=I7MK41_TETTS|nr:membrane-bound O-acyltransferase family MBOAT protein [Tetrahymena thermophila SB210]EAR97515.2 membrane-bound O-acyltransferase family MBOAT protein [Tetrahymena thermophila SB210]|eukprot:XP_001017760.2 membrane-bound O-acyltransferase family MBOAT protein [Tetrahymena thermophila SB210]